MIDTSAIREHMQVIGADGVHVGTVDGVDGNRIKLTKQDSGVQMEGATGSHEGHHHYISTGLIAEIEGDQIRLSTTAANARNFTQEEGELGSGYSGSQHGEGESLSGTEEWRGGERVEVAPDGQDNFADENRGFGEEASH